MGHVDSIITKLLRFIYGLIRAILSYTQEISGWFYLPKSVGVATI